MDSTIKVSLCQMKVIDDKDINIEKAIKMIETSAKNNADVVILPEMFNCPYDNSKFRAYAENLVNGKTIESISKAAREFKVHIIAGSIPELAEEKLYNTCFAIDDNGNTIGRHRKVHLFDVNIPGKIEFRESDMLAPGNDITVVDIGCCKIGIAICYDVRFPELFRLMALKGAQMIVIPAAFNMTTGPLHWELLMRARAVDNQVFIAAVSPARNENANYVAYGNSMVVDPFAEVLVRLGGEEDILYSNIDLSKLTKVRNELPLLKHRREDIYEVYEK
ncbi:carbon-nitrogen hydrolase family protein [Acetivibrio cellulolyticus]|uniref:carbon-nitrogen hydrolase family protein n=1 Tax=Acetivibrio cellulolyticus TaxID=35830 RepID=UPI0001E2CBEE|nr:carbon-nitrogen hydrolase family protein [Acetivibrio cellulolyticus]